MAVGALDHGPAVHEPSGETSHVGPLWAWLRRVLTQRGGMTAEERAELAARRAQAQALKLLLGQLQAEAEEAAVLIAHVLADLNICFRKSNHKGGERVKLVKFSRPMPVTEEALYLPVDLGPRSRPRGVGVAQLADPDTLTNLSVAIGRKVTAKYDEAHGFRYIVWRNDAANGIPMHVRYDDMLALRPTGVDRLGFPLGQGEGKKAYWRSLADIHSLLIAGTTSGGKSNELNVILSTLVSRNGPDFLQLALVDLKRVEFSFYRELPHLATYTYQDATADQVSKRAFVTDAPEALKMLEWVEREIDRRTSLFEKVKVKKLSEWNDGRYKRPRLPYLYVVTDEFALLALDKKVGKKCVESVVKIASVGRALGVGIILCTQYPKSNVVDMRVRAVLNAVMSFTLPSMSASVTVLGAKSAFRLSERPGRFIWQFGPESMEIQAPLITNEKLEAVIEKAKAGEQYQAQLTSGPDVADSEILEWALRENEGSISAPTVARHFSTRGMTLHYARKFLERHYDEQVSVFGTEYVIRRGTNLLPTRLVPVEDADPHSGSTPAAVQP